MMSAFSELPKLAATYHSLRSWFSIMLVAQSTMVLRRFPATAKALNAAVSGGKQSIRQLPKNTLKPTTAYNPGFQLYE